jgi:signal transduction histidine kinase
MRAPSSLRTRIFVASTLAAALSVGSALYFITARINREGEAELRRGLREAVELAERHHRQRLETLTLVARLIADLPRLKAAVETADPPTVQPLAQEYLRQAHADALVVTDAGGALLAAVGLAGADEAGVQGALAGRAVLSTRTEGGRTLEVVTVPLTIGKAEVLGTLSLGLALDSDLAAELRGVTSSEVVIFSGSDVLAATAPLPSFAVQQAGMEQRVTVVRAGDGGTEYAALGKPLVVPGGGEPRPLLVLLRPLTARRDFMRAMRTGLIGAAVVALGLAVSLSYAVARTVTRPMASIAATMREMTRSGDLTREVPAGGDWDDTDARVLADSFRALTGSLRRFQREAALKERLSALGRLSTVVAHEVRNPLMIIKASIRVLGRRDLDPQERAEAVSDIDQEVGRLDRIVQEVLDFARPLQVELVPTDVGAVCRDAAAAAEHDGARVRVNVPSDLPVLHTDGERLRRALVNLLTNARDAVAGRAVEEASRPSIELRAGPLPAGGLSIEVEDRGMGIAAQDLPNIFEPYFSTKRTGTGLGLAITRNIVESLGGTISANSRYGEGTTVRIELPCTPRSEG